jgi:hypothetical protein
MSSSGRPRATTLSSGRRGKWWNWQSVSNMTESPHYKELLQALNDCQVEYLIVGGYAVMKYTEPRYTKDLDV